MERKPEDRPEDNKVQLDGDAAFAKVRELLPKFRSVMMVTHAQAGAVQSGVLRNVREKLRRPIDGSMTNPVSRRTRAN
jgi:hypothetical protein